MVTAFTVRVLLLVLLLRCHGQGHLHLQHSVMQITPDGKASRASCNRLHG